MGGIIIEINNIDIKSYGARLLSYSVGAMESKLSYFVGKNTLYPLITNTEISHVLYLLLSFLKGKVGLK